MSEISKKCEEFKLKWDAFLMGCDSLEDMSLWDKDEFGEMDVYYTNEITTLAIRLIAVDGEITQREVDYLNLSFDFRFTLEEMKDIYFKSEEYIGRSFDEYFKKTLTHLGKINAKLSETYKQAIEAMCDIMILGDGETLKAEATEAEHIKSFLK